jgi:diguanylate cyclase
VGPLQWSSELPHHPHPMPFRRLPALRWPRLKRRLLGLGPERALTLGTLAAVAAALLVGLTAEALDLSPLWPTLLVALSLPIVAWPLLQLWHDAEAERRDIAALASRDDLTGTYNRRHFLAQAEREWARSRRYNMAAAMLMVDVDHFKAVNDRHGHLAGDLMLRSIAQAMRDTLRQADLLGRFGGEEFVVYLPHADTLGALDAAERIRDKVAQLALEWRGGAIRATVSIGVVSLDATHESLSELLADADAALYAAKDAGRNCVRTTPGDQPRRSGEAYPVISR